MEDTEFVIKAGSAKLIPIPEIVEYYISTDSVLFRKRKDNYKIISQYLSNSRDKYRVNLMYKNGTQYPWYVDVLMLITYQGSRGMEYKPHHLDGNRLNNNLDNLEWKLREGVSFFDVLKRNEYELWIKKLDHIPKDRWVEYNEIAFNKYLASSQELAEKPGLRYRFFRKLFNLKSDYRDSRNLLEANDNKDFERNELN